jgi:S1-C subfamily serine protease
MRLTRDQTFQVVLNLRTPTSKDQEIVGTGIFIVKDETKPYILTATHVARGCNSSTIVVISDASSNSRSLNLSLFNPQLKWIYHPIADISVLPVNPDPSISSHLNGRFFPFDQLNTTVSPPSRDTYLTAVGFPNGLGATGKFCPFTFRSHASSSLITLPRFDTNTPSDFFTLENPSVGGYSGGPVFDLGYIIVGAMTTYPGPTICHGIMHGTISDNTGGKIAAVTPCSYVKDII